MSLAESIAEGVFNGATVTPEYLTEIATVCGALKDIETLEAEDINAFYGVEQPPTEEEKKDGE